MTERSTSTAKERAVMEMKTDEKKEDATTVTKMPQRDEVIGTIAGMDGPHRRHLPHRGKGFFVVDSMRLCIAFRYKSRFVAVDGTVGFVLYLVYPSASDRLFVW